MASASTAIAPTGVFSSWEMFVTKSVRIASVRIRSLTSWVVTTAPPAGSGSAWIASHVRGGPWSSTRRVVRSPRQAAARSDSMCSSTSTPMCVPCRIVGGVVAVARSSPSVHRRRHRCRGACRASRNRPTTSSPTRFGSGRTGPGDGAGGVGRRGRCRLGWKDRPGRPIGGDRCRTRPPRRCRCRRRGRASDRSRSRRSLRDATTAPTVGGSLSLSA